MKNTPRGHVAKYFGAIEAGGTKFICAVGDESGNILDEARIETRDPKHTMQDVLDYFGRARRDFDRLQALGVGAFGPLDLTPDSATFGFITSTPKPGWGATDLAGTLTRALNLATFIDTDVNAAALGEMRWGAGRDLSSIAYVTVGTGIGVGVVHHGRAVHGLMHPELGHVYVRRHPADSAFPGTCPYHGDCLEGLASGTAITARIGHTLAQAPADDPIWDIEIDYLGQLSALLVLAHSPQRILIGGGVMQPHMFSSIQRRMRFWLRDYIKLDALQSDDYIRAPGLNSAAGIKGALSLAIFGARHGR